MEGPAEIALTSEPGIVRTSTAGRDCQDPVPGVVISATAKGITERKEAIITFRVNMNTKGGSASQSASYRAMMFPGQQRR
jgi:hypothetical protein